MCAEPRLSFFSYTPTAHATTVMLPTSHGVFDPPKPAVYAQNIVVTGHYDPYAPPRIPTTVAAPVASSSSVKTLRAYKVDLVIAWYLHPTSYPF